MWHSANAIKLFCYDLTFRSAVAPRYRGDPLRVFSPATTYPVLLGAHVEDEERGALAPVGPATILPLSYLPGTSSNLQVPSHASLRLLVHGTSTCYAVPEKSPPSFGRAEHPSRPKRGANRHQQQQQPVSESNTWRGHPLTLGLSPKQLVTGRRAAPCRRHRVCGSCLRVRRSNDYHLITRG